MFTLKMPIFGQLVEKNIVARTMPHPGHAGGQRRAHPGGPAHHPRDLRQRGLRADVRKVYEAIREGESIAKPMKENSQALVPSHGVVLLVLLHRRPDRGL